MAPFDARCWNCVKVLHLHCPCQRPRSLIWWWQPFKLPSPRSPGQVCFLTQFGCLYLCLNLWFSCLDISWRDSNNRGNAHLFIEAWRTGGGLLSISLSCVDPKAIVTQCSMLTSEREKWLRALLFFTEEWLKAPPAASPTQPAMRWASRGSF